MKKPVKIILIIFSVLILLIIAATVYFSASAKKLEALRDISVEDVDLSMVPDGTYTGKHEVFPVLVTVDVTVSNHVITEIELVRHFNGQGQAAESITETVIQEQSLEVDVVSGATYSSKVILLAVKDALRRGRQVNNDHRNCGDVDFNEVRRVLYRTDIK